MVLRRHLFALVVALVVALALPASAAWPGHASVAEAAAKKSSKSKRAKKAKKSRRSRSARRRGKRARKTKVCKRRNGKRRCRWITEFRGHSVPTTKYRAEPLSRPSGDVSVFSVNQREAITVNIYGADGELDDEALANLDMVFRCKRTDRVRAMDPRLYEILSHVHDHFGRVRVELISGFRYRERHSSRHYHASAMDIRVPGVPSRELADFVETLDGGNMGIGRYPTTGFVHVDFRAPGTKSYRWTDYSSSESRRKKPKKHKRPNRPSPRKKRPVS